MPMCWQCGGLGEERLGLPWASHRWFHLAPKRTTAGHGWALQAKWWHLGGNIVKEKPATMPHRQTSREQEGWETAEDTSRSKEMVLHTLGRYSPTAHAEMPEAISHAVPGGPALGQVSMTRMDCSWWRSHTGAGENCNEEGRAERTCNGLITNPHPLSPLHSSVGWDRVSSEGVNLGPGKGGRKVWV